MNSQPPGPKPHSEELARHEARLEEIERERAHILQKIQSIKGAVQFQPLEPAKPKSLNSLASVSFTSAQKVTLFRSLFRGRGDVFPKLWMNPKKATKGYAPACFNEWAPNICGKPQVKCGECPNQAFIPVDDLVIMNHLQGRHTLGVYPMLPDETCWFLAMDFDKDGWMEDVAAIAETCRQEGIPISVERSRSGNGGHVWFFFDSPVSAAQARKMGCFLITETMSRRHQISLESYDRLFPNQDTMPKGGFGNLIALPLQYEPRKHGNSVFLDQGFSPYPDQWDYLLSLKRLSPEQVEEIALSATKNGSVTGVRFVAMPEDEDPEPWARPPSGKVPFITIQGQMPKEIRVIYAQRLFVEKAGLPASLLNRIKRIAAFQNPEFYKKQSMRLSTALTPRIIASTEELPKHLALPRGCLTELEVLARENGIGILLEDQRSEGAPLEVSFNGQLTPQQNKAANTLLENEIGILVAPPGMGKTVLGIFLAAARRRNSLILVHRAPLLDQWVAQLSLFLGISEKEIGIIGGGKRKPTGRIDVAMLQSLVRDGVVDDLVANYGHVIVDECHHLPAVSFEKILAEVKARFVIGLTATPHRRDGLHPISEMQLGPVRYSMDAKKQAALRPFGHRLIRRVTSFQSENPSGVTKIQDLYRLLARDQARNLLILEDVLSVMKEGRSPILLTERKEQLEFFRVSLQGRVQHVVILQGGMTSKKRKTSTAGLTKIPESEERVILATGRFVGEGFDDARLDTLFLAAPISWKGTLTQYAGRLNRLHPGKQEVRIYDYVDGAVPMLSRMFEKRLKTYRALGYSKTEVALSLA